MSREVQVGEGRQQEYLSVPQASRYAGYRSRSSLGRAIRLGRLKAKKLCGDDWALRKEDVDAYLLSLDNCGFPRGARRMILD